MLVLSLLFFVLISCDCRTTNYSIVMGVGDSITAGLGARWSYKRPTLFVYEDCGVSFSTGGDGDVASIATLIEERWGREVSGKSYGSRRVNLCIDRPSNSKELGVAVSDFIFRSLLPEESHQTETPR